MKGLVGGPLLVEGLGPGPPGPPLNPTLRIHFLYNKPVLDGGYEISRLKQLN